MRITKLDGLRGIFSMMIVIHHYNEAYLPQWFYDFFVIRQSYIVVDFFFVLSGFVIALNYNFIKTGNELWEFIKKRFIRLYPLLFYTSSIFLLYKLFSRLVVKQYMPAVFESKLGIDYHEHIQPYIDSLFFTNSTPIWGYSLGLNIPAWSISAEMISYLVFGSLSVFFTLKNKRLGFVLLILFSAIFLKIKGEFFTTVEYGFVRAFVSFFSGYFVWELSHFKFKIKDYLEYFMALFLIAILYVLQVLNRDSSAGVTFSIFFVPLFFSISILLLLKTNGTISRFLDLKPIQYLGKISYSIYLNHYILLSLIVKPIFRIFKFESTLFNQFIVFIFLLALTVFYSHFTYIYIEKKISNRLKKKLLKT